MSEITNPQDVELEEIVLGACLLESKAITLVASILPVPTIAIFILFNSLV